MTYDQWYTDIFMNVYQNYLNNILPYKKNSKFILNNFDDYLKEKI